MSAAAEANRQHATLPTRCMLHNKGKGKDSPIYSIRKYVKLKFFPGAYRTLKVFFHDFRGPY